MQRDRVLIRRVVQVFAVVAAVAFSATVAGAQQATFAGKVTSDGRPLGGASVGIPTLGVGAITAVDGRYNFTVDVSKSGGRTVDLVARYIGHKPKRLPLILKVGRTDKDFDLDKDILNLEQVVVTGVSGATSQKNTAFAVAVIDETALKDAPGTSPLASLSGKIAGASVVTVSGQPGAAPAIRLRSPASISGKTDPLIIVDGTITRLSLADIASEDIERVEVIKGAAASSLYGSDAANGVVQIFTKRGASLAEGQSSFTVRNEFGRNTLPRTVPGNMSHAYKVLPNGDFDRDANGNRVLKADQISDNSYLKTYDQLGQVFHDGSFITNYASFGQRRGENNFNASFQNTKDGGVLNLLSGFSRQNFRVNLDQALSDKIDLSTGAFYGPVWVVVVNDFQCEDCKAWHDDILPLLRERYISRGRVRVALLNRPMPSHSNATVSALVAACASAEGKFWETSRRIFATQSRWKALPDARPFLDSLALAAGVDSASHRVCSDRARGQKLVHLDVERTSATGADSVPTFFIGTHKRVGAIGPKRFFAAVDSALAGK